MNYYQNIYIGGGDGGNGAAMLTKSETSRNARRDVAIPESFDSRAKWENCITISSIRDQGDCGACWSFSAVQVLADRFCVKGQMVPELSAQYLIDCFGDSGCVGGYADVAWERLVTNGTVSEKCSSYIENVGVCNNTCWSSQEEQFKLYKASTGVTKHHIHITTTQLGSSKFFFFLLLLLLPFFPPSTLCMWKETLRLRRNSFSSRSWKRGRWEHHCLCTTTFTTTRRACMRTSPLRRLWECTQSRSWGGV